MNKKRMIGTALASALLVLPMGVQTTKVLADGFYSSQTNAQRADITNWVANTSQQIHSNMQAQHIDTNNLHNSRYVIQWGDTLSGISQATGISINKLAYDNHIQNIDLIFAGDVLILNRDGEVPADWHYYGDGNYVAKTKVTINNFTDNSDNSDHSVRINVSPYTDKSVTNNDNSSKTNNNFTANGNGNNTNNNNTKDDSSTKDSSDSKSSDQMSDSEFSDKVKDEVKDKLNLDDDKLNINFSSDKSDDAQSESTKDDSDNKDVYSSDQTVSLSSSKLTDENAKDIADKIVSQLKDDNKDDDIKKADNVSFTISKDGKDYKFNVTLAKSDSDDNSSSSSDSDSSSSSDDSSSSSSSSESKDDDSSSSSSSSSNSDNNQVDSNNDNDADN